MSAPERPFVWTTPPVERRPVASLSLWSRLGAWFRYRSASWPTARVVRGDAGRSSRPPPLPPPCWRCGQIAPHVVGERCDGIPILPIPGPGVVSSR